MYVIPDNILISPLQIESAQYVESPLVLNNKSLGAKINIVMASGAKYEINQDNCNDVLKAMQELVFQIDLACGMKFEPKAEDTEKKAAVARAEEEEAEKAKEERTGLI